MPPAPEFSLPQAGRIWRFGDDVDTDAMAPGSYMKAGIDVLAQHCLAALRPGGGRPTPKAGYASEARPR